MTMIPKYYKHACIACSQGGVSQTQIDKMVHFSLQNGQKFVVL